MEQALKALGAAFQLRERSLGADARLRVSPMRFRLRQFDVCGIGNLALIQGQAMMGLMRMETWILTPLARDAPMFSFDRIRALGRDTLIAEWYDTRVSPVGSPSMSRLEALRGDLASIPAYDLGAHWYDALKLPASCAHRGRNCAAVFDAYLEKAIDGYIALLRASPVADEAAKIRRTTDYVDGLFARGGPSTDAFVRALGRERAQVLFRSVVFGIE